MWFIRGLFHFWSLKVSFLILCMSHFQQFEVEVESIIKYFFYALIYGRGSVKVCKVPVIDVDIHLKYKIVFDLLLNLCILALM